MKVAFITTITHNPGDDFVREGIKYLINSVYADKKVEYNNIHKHTPITVRNGFEWFKDIKYSKFTFSFKWLDNLLPLSLSGDKILDADLVIQSGAPVYWCIPEVNGHCADNEWYTPLIRRRLPKSKAAQLLNIGAGTCQPYHSDGSEFLKSQKDIDYIKEFYEASSVTTLRDTLAGKVLASIGLDAPVIPCPSIFGVDEHNLKPQKREYVVMNYMSKGGHYAFGAEMKTDQWFHEITDFYNRIKKEERVLFVCHNKKEVADTKKIDPNAETFYSDNFLDYMKVYGGAKLGILNRVHGAFMTASYGVPSLVIGNDSRAKMAHEIGLQSIFINDATSDILYEHYQRLQKETDTFKAKFDAIKSKAFDDYMKVLKPALLSE